LGKPCAFTGQSLISHMEGVEKLVREAFVEEGYAKIVRKRLSKIRQSLPHHPDFPEEVVEDAIVLTAVSHDLGKAVEYFQRQLTNDCSGRASFHPHEVLSGAYLIKAVADQSPLLPFITTAVMMHHHAMRVPDKKTLEKAQEVVRGGGKVVGAGELHKFLSRIKSFSLKEVGEITPDDVERLRLYINQVINSTPYTGVPTSSSLQVYSLFLLPLVVSDNLDSTRRGDDEDRRLFIVELKNIYGD